MNGKNDRDELFRHRIKSLLQHVNGQPNGHDSNASIESELSGIDAVLMEDDEVRRIMNQVRRSMMEAARSRDEVNAMQNRMATQRTSPDLRADSLREGRNRQPVGSAGMVVLAATVLCLTTAIGLFQVSHRSRSASGPGGPVVPGTRLVHEAGQLNASSPLFRYVAMPRPQVMTTDRMEVGQTLRTAARERRQVQLPDGSRLYLNERSTVSLTGSRTVSLYRGQIFVEVTPADRSDRGPFVVETPERSVTALGTKFAVSAEEQDTEVLVTQGKVRVSGADRVVTGGQVATTAGDRKDVTIEASPRASQALSWTRELIAAAEAPLVPRSDHVGGSLVVVDPSGQEMKLSLRKFHVDAWIEDGFARTTIDQTYFNHTHSRQEGTFKFPLPPDASLSRLAMYVNGKLMEGGMVERDHGRNVFEQIMHTKRDPALLEWVDGSTFRMRVFPLEPRQEKRIVLSYTQRLSSDYGRTEYRFPAGHSFETVRDWSTRLTVANGTGKVRWFSPTHLLDSSDEDGDLVIEGDLQNAVLDDDLVVELTSVDSKRQRLSREFEETASFSTADHEGHRYQMLRFRPELSGELVRPRRNWVFLFESSGDRNPLLARVQLDVIQTLLEHAEHEDTFSVISAATRSDAFRIKPVPCSRKNIRKAVAWLENRHLVGALDLENALNRTRPLCRTADDTLLVHVGSATPVLGERDTKKLLKLLPSDVEYVGVGVGKRWSRSFMKSAAGQTGGYFTQINPDENVSWRAFDLLSTLNAPRLTDIVVNADRRNVRFLTFAETVSHGQEIAAVARLPRQAKSLDSVTVSGLLNGQPFRRTLEVENVDTQADYLPRTWARLEIDRLVADGAGKNRDAIIRLSKAMYVMSPFTSLLVLEDEAMYEQFNVDRGRKDHWALYPAPESIQVVHEPGPAEPKVNDPVQVLDERLKRLRAKRDLAQTSLDRGVRDGRATEDVENLRQQLLERQRAVEAAERLVRSVEQAKNSRLLKSIKTVLFRRPPTVTVPVSYVYNRPDGRRSELLMGIDSKATRWYTDFDVSQTQGELSGVNAEWVNLWGLPSPEALARWNDVNGDWSFDVSMNGVLDAPFSTGGSDGGVFYDLPMMTGEDVDSAVDFERMLGDIQRFDESSRMYRLSPVKGPLSNRARFGMSWSRLSKGVQSAPINESFHWMFGAGRNQGMNLSFGEPTHRVIGGAAFLNNSRGGVPGEQQLRQLALSSQLEGLPVVSRGHNQAGIGLGWARPEVAFETEFSSILLDASSLSVGFIVAAPESLPVTADRYFVPFGRDSMLDGFVAPDASLNFRYTGVNPSDVALDDILQFQIMQSDDNPFDDFLVSRLLSPQPISDSRFGFAGQNLSGDQLMTRLGGSSAGFGGRFVPGQELITVAVQRPGVLRNLLTYAPGMQTTLNDLLAIVADEVPSDEVRGTVDPAARRLIENCRSRGWEEFTLSDDSNEITLRLRCNGSGDLRLVRRTTDGLLEQVSAEGAQLLHLYPELGIGAERSISRFHRRSLLRLTPWNLPSADVLSMNCDVRQLCERVIRITRTSTDEVEVEAEEENSNEFQAGKELAIDLSFAPDGRLVERRLVEITDEPEHSERLLIRHVYDASGSVRIVDGDDQVLFELKFQRRPIDALRESPSTDGLVILPLPYRSADSYSLVLPAQPAESGSVDYSQLSESDAMKLVATHVANSDFDALWNVINQRFVSQDDCRMGFAVLLSAAATGNSQPIHEVASRNQGDASLGSFLVQHFEWWNDQDRNREFVLPDSASPFLSHLVEAHNLFALWSSGRATKDRTEAQVDRELSRAFEIIRSCRSKRTAWQLLNVVRQAIAQAFAESKLHLRLANEASRFEDVSGFSYAARYARSLWLIPAGKRGKALNLYGAICRDAADAGIVPVVSDEFRSAFLEAGGSRSAWNRMILESAEPLMDAHRSLELIELALQCAMLSEHDTAIELVNHSVADVDVDDRPDLLIGGLRCFIAAGRWDRAEDFVRRLMSDDSARRTAVLWRTASQIASELGDEDESLRRLEQAMRLEFASLPELVDVAALRADYSHLFDRFQSLAELKLEQRKPLPDDFVNRISQAADAWRSVDPDPAPACHRAASLLQMIGLHADAWDYWTTSLVDMASSSEAWKNLAVVLAETGQVHRASQAWEEAFAAEPTDPELLWNHAILLREHQQSERAKKILTQIVSGKWQPRFEQYRSKARTLLQKL